MKKQHALIKGTVILTLTGFISRIIGFFYRIFLARVIGAEGLGLYQLIFPIFAICFSLTAAAIQTSISRFVAEQVSTGNRSLARPILFTGLSLSTILSCIIALILHNQAGYLSASILNETRCKELLEILAYSIPFGAIHSCISGYYYGLKKTGVPAASQLIEQIIRVLSVFLIYRISVEKGFSITPSIAVLGMVFGEIASMLVCVTALSGDITRNPSIKGKRYSYRTHLKNILSVSVPLTANKLLLNILQSAEAILIPSMLRISGMSVSSALSTYGILTGMTLPLILFPSAITNSVSVMLLPTVAEAHAGGRNDMISRTIENTIKYCLLLGYLFTGIFLAYGQQMGQIIFGNAMAGKFILILAWICPFLYLTTTLGSILNGLGKTTSVFIQNAAGLAVRIFFVIFCIPKVGIIGYLWGLLVSELLICFMSLTKLSRTIIIRFSAINWIGKPVVLVFISMGIGLLSTPLFSFFSSPFLLLFIGIGMSCLAYLILLLVTRCIPVPHK